MENCYIRTTDQGSKFQIFLFCLFGMKGFLKKRIVKGKKIFFISIPLPSSLKEKQRKKYFKHLCKLFHNMHIKNICAYNINDLQLLSYLKTEFYIFNGASVFYSCFDEILNHFSQKIEYSLKECEVALISNYPKEAKQYILKIIRDVKSVVIYTKQPDKFKNMVEEIKNQYGIYITLKNQEERLKKYKRIYVNLEPLPIFKETLFKSLYMIDIYKVYKGAFCDVIISYTTKEDNMINEYQIIKNLCFTEYLKKLHHFNEKWENSTKNFKENDYKIVNIVKK